MKNTKTIYKKEPLRLSTTHIVLLSFLFLILLGSLLLSLPISHADGVSVSYVDALFTATTSTCVTGLVTLTTVATWSGFGQAVILFLIQVGGLGTVTVMAAFLLAFQKRFGLRDSLLIQDAFNLTSLSGLAAFVRRVLIGTLILEGTGALLYMTVFVPEMGLRGVWVSIFTAVSAFCNAGIDIIGAESLYAYATNPLINFVTEALIILGGIGFIVWWDLLGVLKNLRREGLACLRRLSLHAKIALSSTALLVFGGAILFFAFEYNNPDTLGAYSLFDKIQISLFQSVTTRTAGFATIAQENLGAPAAMVSVLLMAIGGSPAGTAGGIKTVTIVVLLAAAISTARNKGQVSLFHRALSENAIRRALSVTAIFVLILLSSTVALAALTDASLLDIVFETVSATATVGLSRGLTSLLSVAGKFVIIATMYFGRVGPISLAVAFAVRCEQENMIKNPEEEISVG